MTSFLYKQVVFHFHDYTIYVKEFYYVATI